MVTLLRACGHCPFCSRGERQLCETKLPLDLCSPLSAADGSPIRQGLRTAAFAEAVVVDASQVVAIPRELSLERASPAGVRRDHRRRRGAQHRAMRPGSHVATIGTGGVGLNCVQGAALGGARTNIAIDLSERKLAAARTFGASHAINPASRMCAPRCAALTEGRGADYVFVAAGSAAAIEQGARLLRRGGTLVVVGMTADGVQVRLEAVDIADQRAAHPGQQDGLGADAA